MIQMRALGNIGYLDRRGLLHGHAEYGIDFVAEAGAFASYEFSSRPYQL